MKAKLFNLLLLIAAMVCTSYFSLYGQIYPDHFGTGNDVGVSATSSPTQNGDSLETTLNGTGYFTDDTGLYRFMAQAGFGATQEDIDSLQNMGIENWIDWQVAMPYETFQDRYINIYNEVMSEMYAYQSLPGNAGLTVYDFKSTRYVPMAFYEKVIIDKDILRQKMAFALSQIFVVGMTTAEGGRIERRKGEAYSIYYDILYDNAFGNFRDILGDVTLNPVMGDFLSYFNNKKENQSENTRPDENYAREIMQLFTIGLYELNNDGTKKLDVDGQPIPTYDLDDIREMAKVFTGLYGAGVDSTITSIPYEFGNTTNGYDWNQPMVMDTSYHDQSVKILPNGDTIPANQAGMNDIDMALDWLFSHDNVGPFIARRLIQQLVKSNPSPEYINRVASAFNNNGYNVRGDLGAVCKAILLDTEARDCDWIEHPYAGKLLQPMERNINLFKAFNITTPSGKFRFIDYDTQTISNNGEESYSMQAFLNSPTVFNFFSPNYAESKTIEPEGLVSPEFGIFNAVTSIHYLNKTRDVIEKMGNYNNSSYIWTSQNGEYPSAPFLNMTHITNGGNGIKLRPDSLISSNPLVFGFDNPVLDFENEVCICEVGDGTKDIDGLLEHLNLVLCRGQLSHGTKNLIIDNIEEQLDHIDEFDASNTYVHIGYDEPPNPLKDTHLSYSCLSYEDPMAPSFNCLRIVKEMVYLIMASPDYVILR